MDKLSPAQKDGFIDNLKREMAAQSIKEMILGMNDKCFKKCIYVPGSSISSSESNCLSTCVDRFMDSRNLITHAFLAAAQGTLKGGLDNGLQFD